MVAAELGRELVDGHPDAVVGQDHSIQLGAFAA
jgi:hypothetical protein